MKRITDSSPFTLIDGMVSWVMQSNALWVAKTLFWGSVLTSLASLLTDTYLHALLMIYWKPPLGTHNK